MEMDKEAEKNGLKMNYEKINTEEISSIIIGEKGLERVSEYIYIGQVLILNKKTQTA